MISRILVPMDGSKAARKAAKYAIDVAKQTGASITLLSVIDNRLIVSQAVSDTVSPTHLKEGIEDYLKQSVQAVINKTANECAQKRIRCKALIRAGHPVEEIVSEAEKSRASLIIMGSHGRSALSAAVLGSVTYGVVHRDSKIPLLIVKQ